jgi:hypothetical protein
VYLTGRTEDGAWLELRAPSDPGARVWVEAAVVDPDGGVDDLEVHDCDLAGQQLARPGQTTTTVTSTTLPGETTTTEPGDTTTTTEPTTSTTKPTTTTTKPTTTTTEPDTKAPSVSGLAADINDIYTSDGNCGPTAHSTPVSATVLDNKGLASVTLSWSFPGKNGTVSGSKPMTLSGGKYRATFGPFPYGTIAVNGHPNVAWKVRAVDTSGNVQETTVSVSEQVTVWDSCFG